MEASLAKQSNYETKGTIVLPITFVTFFLLIVCIQFWKGGLKLLSATMY